MHLDRTIAPPLKPVSEVSFIPVEEKSLKNGVPCFYIDGGSQEVCKVELILQAGKKYNSHPLVAPCVNKLLREGTTSRSAQEFANALDSVGAFLNTETDQDIASISLYSLNKHIEASLMLFSEMYHSAIHPEKDFKLYQNNGKQKFIVSQQRVGSVARRVFPSLLFENDHPYGGVLQVEQYDALEHKDVRSFYESFYIPANLTIVVAGKVPPQLPDLLDGLFGEALVRKASPVSLGSVVSKEPTKQFIEVKDTVQSAIRIGASGPVKSHPDFLGLQVLNTVFGGYFGSRLMTNIREDKGYTYGIGSAALSLKDAGMIFLATEVGSDVCGKAKDEIYMEMNRLCQDLIPDGELDLVRNYMLGQFLKNMDGPLEQADRFVGRHMHQLDESYYQNYLATIREINAVQLRDLAQEWLNPERMVEVVVGPGKS